MRWLNLLTVVAFFVSIAAHAGTRDDHWSGFDVGAGEPFPSLAGIMVGFNIGDDARVTGGVGTFSRWSTYQVDAKFFLATTPWAGYIGAGLDYMDGKAGTFALWTYNFDHSLMPYLSTGIDLQTAEGLHLNFNLAAAIPNSTITILPGLAVGWYF